MLGSASRLHDVVALPISLGRRSGGALGISQSGLASAKLGGVCAEAPEKSLARPVRTVVSRLRRERGASQEAVHWALQRNRIHNPDRRFRSCVKRSTTGHQVSHPSSILPEATIDQ